MEYLYLLEIEYKILDYLRDLEDILVIALG
jgi:hypothetical protein